MGAEDIKMKKNEIKLVAVLHFKLSDLDRNRNFTKTWDLLDCDKLLWLSLPANDLQYFMETVDQQDLSGGIYFRNQDGLGQFSKES